MKQSFIFLTVCFKSDDNKEFEVKAIRDSAVYVRKLEFGYLSKTLLPSSVERLL